MLGFKSGAPVAVRLIANGRNEILSGPGFVRKRAGGCSGDAAGPWRGAAGFWVDRLGQPGHNKEIGWGAVGRSRALLGGAAGRSVVRGGIRGVSWKKALVRLVAGVFAGKNPG